jgi:hypothetical protein
MRKHWCPCCQRRVLFPQAHFWLHLADSVKADAEAERRGQPRG